MQRRVAVGAVALAATATLMWWQFSQDLATARISSSLVSTLIEIPCAVIQYQEAGTGQPLLAVHGSNGGFDQGMAFAAPLAAQGIRVIAMSRLGICARPCPPVRQPKRRPIPLFA